MSLELQIEVKIIIKINTNTKTETKIEIELKLKLKLKLNHLSDKDLLLHVSRLSQMLMIGDNYSITITGEYFLFLLLPYFLSYLLDFHYIPSLIDSTPPNNSHFPYHFFINSSSYINPGFPHLQCDDLDLVFRGG